MIWLEHTLDCSSLSMNTSNFRMYVHRPGQAAMDRSEHLRGGVHGGRRQPLHDRPQ